MFTIEEKEKVFNLKSLKILKWAIPVFCSSLIALYFSFIHHSSITTGTKYFIFDIVYTVLIFPVMLVSLLIIAAIIGLIVDIMEIILERK